MRLPERHQPCEPNNLWPAPHIEAVSNQDNFNIYGGRVNPPDPNAAVGKNHIVEMANLAFAVYDKATGNRIGPVHAIGDLWANFAVPSCRRYFRRTR